MHIGKSAFMHRRTYTDDMKNEMAVMYTNLSRGEGAKFNGVYIDTGANRSSLMSYAQYKAYCNEFHVPIRMSKADRKNLRGIGGGSSPIGTAILPCTIPRPEPRH